MNKLFNIVKWGATLGSSPQNFLGAKWVRRMLDRAKPEKKHVWALRLLSLSPHYFLNPDDPKYQGLSNDEYLEQVFQESLASRRKIFDHILKERLEPSDVVIDYGCGPGFLAVETSKHVKHLYAIDISEGALACAEVLNNNENLNYVVANEAGFASIPDESVDAIYSFAMIQHIADDIYDIVLENCRKKLKPGGKLILHIQLLNGNWRSEEEWRNDTSISGKLKFKYGLHCFGRSEEAHAERLVKHGFTNPTIFPVVELIEEDFDDVGSQHLLISSKP